MIFKKREFDKKIFFVIGTGRSGTHLLGRTLGNSKHITAFIEDERFFSEITNLATGLNPNRKEYSKILKKYKKDFLRCNTQYILEKTHPNIWFVEDILEYFPSSKFIGIKRNSYSTIASMLNHKGILRWYDVLPQDKVNPFLGITAENVSYFSDLPLESKCALRWKAHNVRLNELTKNFPESVHVINYDNFYKSNDDLLVGIKSFLGIDFEIPVEQLNTDGLEKWKKTLGKAEIINIDKVLLNNLM